MKIPLLISTAILLSSVHSFVPHRYHAHDTPSKLSMHNNKKKKKSKSKRTSKSSGGHGFGASASFSYAGSIRPGSISPQRIVAEGDVTSIPDYALDGVPKAKAPAFPWMIEVKTPEEIEKMRAAGKLARKVLDLAGRAVDVGVTTEEIDSLVHESIVEAGAYPSPLNFHGFPKSCCTSVNEVMCHGIPDSRKLEEGDIINLDITVYLDGYHGDCSEMFVVGSSISPETKRLLQATYDCWIKACDYVQPGRKYNAIGGIIEDHVELEGFSSAEGFAGHGIGSLFHTTPDIYHFHNAERCGEMVAGHTFTIEPIICQGKNADALFWPDKWTATTVDGKLSAQFEHTLLITADGGVEALTAKNENSMLQFWEQESKVHKGIWIGTSEAAKKRAMEINDKLAIE